MDYHFGWPNVIAGGAIGGMILALITSCWAKIKLLFWRACSYFISYVEIQDGPTNHALLTYLAQHFGRSRVYDRVYGGNYEYARDGRYGLVPFEFLGNKTLVFWKGWRFLIYGMQRPQQQGNAPAPAPSMNKHTLMFLRGTFDVENIIKQACASRNELAWNVTKDARQRRFFIRKVPNHKERNLDNRYAVGTSIAWYHEGSYRLLAHAPSDLGRCQPGHRKALDRLFFPERIKKLIREIQIWRNHRDWYIERGIPWKRGWLLYGPPGTGKTALVRAFAEDEDLPLFVFSLRELMNGELQRSWDDMQAHVPCIALFEDLDNVFHGRANIAGQELGLGAVLANVAQPKAPAGEKGQPDAQQPLKIGMLSFDCLLNCIDGVEKSEGVFTIITTNDISRIDAALGQPRKLPDGSVEFISSRPGRIDKAIELTYMEPPEKRRMAEQILADTPEALWQMREFLDRYPDLLETAAQFQERCAQLALSCFWEERAALEELIGSDTTKQMRHRSFQVSGRQELEVK